MAAVCCIRISFNVDSMKVINNAPVDADADDGKGGVVEKGSGKGARDADGAAAMISFAEL